MSEAPFQSVTSGGLRQSWVGITNKLRKDLKLYPFDDGRTILRELAQNADDAGAKRLTLNVCGAGIPDAQNPLLRGPALIAHNDGGFTAEHEVGLISSDETSKSRDSAAIGRFGIGRLSVFHFSEAWFYVGRDAGGRPRGGVVNPWVGYRPDGTPYDPDKPDWPNLKAEDQGRLLAALGPRVAEPGWLALWLPLRDPSHRRKSGPPIVDIDWTAADVLGKMGDLASVVEMIPQLHSLREVRVVHSHAPGGEEHLVGSVRLSSNAMRLARPTTSVPEEPGRGEVEWEREGRTTSYSYSLRQRLSEDQILSLLRDHPNWPTVPFADGDVRNAVPEKAVPHGAVTVFRGYGAHPQVLAGVGVGWAVYLPMGDIESSHAPTSLKEPWSLRLHGSFFPDAGRRHVLGWESRDLEEVSADRLAPDVGDPRPPSARHEATDVWFRKQWNHRLREHVVLPLVLPALAGELATLEADEAEAVLRALAINPVVERHARGIGATQQLVLALQPSGFVVRLLPSSRLVLPVPVRRPGSTAWKKVIVPVLSALERSGSSVVLAVQGVPIIGGTPSQRVWTAPVIDAILTEAVLKLVGRSADAMEWVAGLLAIVYEQRPQLASDTALRWLKAGVAHLGEGDLRHADVRSSWAQIAALVPATRKFETDAYRAIPLVAPLFENVAVIPADVRSGPGLPNLRRAWEDREWRDALRALSEGVSRGEREGDSALVVTCGQLAGELIAAMDAVSLVKDDPVLSSLNLFRIHSCRHSDKRTVSARVVIEAKERGLAFGGLRGVTGNPIGHCNALFSAVDAPDHDVLFLSDDAVATALGIPEASETHLLSCFGSEIALNPVGTGKQRQDLLDAVLTKRAMNLLRTPRADADLGLQDFLAAIRVVLTGDRRGRERRTQTLYLRDGSFPLPDLACRSLLRLSGRDWQLLPQWVDLLKPWKDSLRVDLLTKEFLLGALREAEDAAVAEFCSTRTSEELADLGAFVGKEDVALWKRLPIHLSTTGRRVPADALLFRESDNLSVPAILLARVHLLASPTALYKVHIPPWTASDQLSHSLAAALTVLPSDPASALAVAEAVLDALGRLDEPSDRRAACDVAWLPLVSGGRVCPEDLLALPANVAAAARSVFHGDEGDFVLVCEVDRACVAHPAFERVIAMGRSDLRAALDGLGLRLAVLPEGARAGLLVASRPDQLPPPDLVAKSDAALTHPGLKLMRAVRLAMDESEIRGDLTADLKSALCGTLSAPMIASLLRAVATSASSGCGTAIIDERLLVHFLSFLKPSGANGSDRAAALAGVQLKSANGHWLPAEELSACPNIEDSHRLDSEMVAALALRADPAFGADRPSLRVSHPSAEVDAGPKVLLQHFGDWMSKVPHAALGVLAAILGDGTNGGMKAQASDWLGSFLTVETVRQELAREAIHVVWTLQPNIVARVGGSKVAVRSMKDGQPVQVPSIVGVAVWARVGGGIGGDHIVVTDDVWADSESGTGGSGIGESCQWLQLRAIDAASYSREKLLEILLHTIERVFLRLTGYKAGPGLRELWFNLSGDAPNEVDVALQEIRRELRWQLEQLGGCGGQADASKLVSGLAVLYEAQRRTDELSVLRRREPGRESDRKWQENEAEKRLYDARSALEQLVETDAATGRYLLERVRLKVGEAQYEIARVPFELFQNADDAISQLEQMTEADGGELAEGLRHFAVEFDPEPVPTVRTWHWGRRINECAIGAGFTAGRTLRYDRDLVNMLRLHASDKLDQGSVTGKFGLGFKAVHLVSHSPRVQSGTTAFEIRGGFFPVPLAVNHTWQRTHRAGRTPTIVELPLDATCRPHELLATFRACAGLLPVFAQSIRSLSLRDGRESTVCWRPVRLPLPSVFAEVGELEIDLANVGRSRLLVVHANEKGPRSSVAFAIGPRGLTALSPSLPTFWATAPTQVVSKAGWCVNGPFAVDIGRTQLGLTQAHRDQNLLVVEAIGSTVSRAFGEIFDLLHADWPTHAPLFDLPARPADASAAEYAFWESVWDQLTSPVTATGVDGASTRDALLALARRWTAFINGRAALPTGLGGGWRGLANPEAVTHVATDILARPEIALVVSEWAWVKGAYARGAVIHPGVDRALHTLRTDWHRQTVDLADLIAQRDLQGPVTVEDVEALAPVYGWLSAEPGLMMDETRRGVREVLRRLRFQNEAGGAVPSAELLLPVLDAGTRDEVRRIGGSRAEADLKLLADDHRLAAFAPAARRLASGWTTNPEVLLVYFEGRRDRPDLGTPTEIAGWMRGLEAVESRVAALNYLVEGARGGPVSRVLQNERLPWASSPDVLTASGLLAHFRKEVLPFLLVQLFPDRMGVQQVNVPPPLPPTLEGLEQIPPDPGAAERALAGIAKWWDDDEVRDAAIARWEGDAYPDWLPAKEVRRRLLQGGSTPAVNEAWLLLLVLGLCSRLGRTKEKTAANFVTRLRAGGWWDTMVAGPENGAAWIEGLTAWLDGGVDYREYDHWVSLLPWIYQARRWLEPYSRTLGAPAQVLGESGFKYLWVQRINPSLQGTDLDAPPFLQFFGVPGRWVLRELVRLGVVPGSERLERETWVPRRAVRVLLNHLGLPLSETGDRDTDSRRIQEFVMRHLGPKANFRGDYDIPLLIVALSRPLREAAIHGTLSPLNRADDGGAESLPEPELP